MTRFTMMRRRLDSGMGDGLHRVTRLWPELVEDMLPHEDLGYITHKSDVRAGDRITEGNCLLWAIMRRWIDRGGEFHGE
jgi:hypothetical protein